VEVERAVVVETSLEQTHKLFLDKKENSCACLLGYMARQEKEAELAQSQFDLFKERHGKDSGGITEMETRLNLDISAIHDLRSECNETVQKIAASKKGIAANDNTDLTQPTYIKAKSATVNRLGDIFNFLQAQLQVALDQVATWQNCSGFRRLVGTSMVKQVLELLLRMKKNNGAENMDEWCFWRMPSNSPEAEKMEKNKVARLKQGFGIKTAE
jgi:hypothetical protein